MALAWSVSAKNSLANHHGYSPNQLVFGQNFDFPSVIVNKPPAQRAKATSVKVQEHLQALHKARERFTKSESNEKIKRALRHKTRTFSDMIISNGDKVYYAWPR